DGGSGRLRRRAARRPEPALPRARLHQPPARAAHRRPRAPARAQPRAARPGPGGGPTLRASGRAAPAFRPRPPSQPRRPRPVRGRHRPVRPRPRLAPGLAPGAIIRPMQYRALGKSGVTVSEIGYGAWGLGRREWIGADDRESMRSLHRAIDLGVNFIDTALAYGDGHSESLIGRVLKERRDKVLVATKVPPKNRRWPAPEDVPVSQTYPGDHIVAACERSLRNLGRDHVDLLQLHTWQDHFLDQDGWKDALGSLKKSGKALLVGVSVNDHDPASALRAVRSGLFDTFQVIYNVFDQSPEKDLFPACREHGRGVIARVP